jgi:hypothetical protein
MERRRDIRAAVVDPHVTSAMQRFAAGEPRMDAPAGIT